MKLKLIKGLAAAGIVGFLASCAGGGPSQTLAEGARCFRSNDVVDFRQTSQTSFIVHTLQHNVFSADVPACQGMDWAQMVALTPIRGSQICEGDEARIVTRDPAGRQITCSIFAIHELSPAEVSALPSQIQP